MKQEALFKKLGNILNELNSQYEFLAQNPDQLSEVELELFLANTNFLVDHIQIIKKLNLPMVAHIAVKEEVKREVPVVENELPLKQPSSVEITPDDKTKEVEPATEEANINFFEPEEESAATFEFVLNTNEYTEDDKFDFEEESADKLFDRTLSKEEELILAQKRKVSLLQETEILEEDEIGPEPFLVHNEKGVVEEPKIDEPNIENPTIIESQKITIEKTKIEVETEYKPTLNDLLSQKNLGARLNETSGPVISDLKTAINLNDKLLYIKDLFNGYNLAYAEAIDIANKMPNFDAADNFLQKNYAISNNWADNQATVDKFYILLNRRFKS